MFYFQVCMEDLIMMVCLYLVMRKQWYHHGGVGGCCILSLIFGDLHPL